MNTENTTPDHGRGESMPLSNISALESSYRLLTNLNLGLLIFAGVVALAIGVVSVLSARKGDELLRAKDAQLASEMKSKDKKIEFVKAGAAIEAKRIETEGKERIATVEAEASKQIIEARTRADEANVEAKRATLAQEGLKQQNLATAEELEKERKTRLELEQSLAPRLIGLKVSGRKSNIDPLKPFAGIQMFVDVMPDDAEAQRTAGHIIWLAQEAGWKLSEARINPEVSLFDGVEIIAYKCKRSPENPFGTEEERAAEKFSQDATEALVDFLKTNNWSANALLHSSMGHNPPNSVKIIVGIKPSPYFLPKELKEMREQMKKIDEETKNRIKQREKENKDFMRQFPQTPVKPPPRQE